LDISSRVQFAKDLRVEAAEGQKEEDREKRVRIIVKVGVIKRQEAVMMEDLETNNARDNFARDVEIKEKILSNRLAAVRAHQYGHF